MYGAAGFGFVLRGAGHQYHNTSYTHTNPDPDSNYYWVVACNSSGCSAVDSSNPATTAGTPPAAPTASYEWDGSSIVVSWDAVADADFYDVYYDDFFGSSCTVRRGSASFCEELATNVAGTSFTHADPGPVTATTTGLSRVTVRGVLRSTRQQPGNDGRYPTGGADGQLRVGRVEHCCVVGCGCRR